jgi:hypothetical protein
MICWKASALDVPDKTHCFVDANIFYYHLVDTPPLSDDCSDFLKRFERGDLIGSTSTAAIGEATHKKNFGLSQLAADDYDFDQIAGTVWKPR